MNMRNIYLLGLIPLVIAFFSELSEDNWDGFWWAVTALVLWGLAFRNLYRARRAKKDVDWMAHIMSTMTRNWDRRSYFRLTDTRA